MWAARRPRGTQATRNSGVIGRAVFLPVSCGSWSALLGQRDHQERLRRPERGEGLPVHRADRGGVAAERDLLGAAAASEAAASAEACAAAARRAARRRARDIRAEIPGD